MAIKGQPSNPPGGGGSTNGRETKSTSLGFRIGLVVVPVVAVGLVAVVVLVVNVMVALVTKPGQIDKLWPIKIRSGLGIEFDWAKVSTVVPLASARRKSVSPVLTTYEKQLLCAYAIVETLANKQSSTSVSKTVRGLRVTDTPFASCLRYI